jgi:BirA family transcriptional regulator, biotin operon repressor / biotin---[acetyl-CoA-carboxylase] ligase
VSAGGFTSWGLPTRHVGRRVLVFDRVDSTNSLAAALATDPANDGVAVLAREQTTGRGQYGRAWLARADTSVLLSVLLFPPPELRRPVLLTAWAAVAVCRTVKHFTGFDARIKWPNDVLVLGKKVCGILLEQGTGTVAGIGLNVSQTAEEFAFAGLPHAASLSQFTVQVLAPDEVARTLIAELDYWYGVLLDGRHADLERAWQRHLGLVGAHVRLELPEAVHQGRLRSVSFDAAVLEREGTVPLSVAPERVQHIHPA